MSLYFSISLFQQFYPFRSDSLEPREGFGPYMLAPMNTIEVNDLDMTSILIEEDISARVVLMPHTSFAQFSREATDTAEDEVAIRESVIVDEVIEGIWTFGKPARIPALAQDAAYTNLPICHRLGRESVQAHGILITPPRFALAEESVPYTAQNTRRAELLDDHTIR